MRWMDQTGSVPRHARRRVPLTDVDLALAMFSLRHQHLLVEAGHAYLAAGQQGLTDHDDEQGHDNHGDGEEREEPAAGAWDPSGRLPAPPAAPLAPAPFMRAASRCATAGSNFFTSLSGVTEMTTGFLVAVSFTVIVDAAAFTAKIGPARLRKLPLTISSASSVAPSSLLEPRARSWSPGLIWSRELLIAWSNRTEPAA